MPKSIFYFCLLPTFVSSCVMDDPPQKVLVTINATSSEIDKGDNLEIAWISNNAKSCSIADRSGFTKKDLPPSGNEVFTPSADQTYTVSCEPAIKGDKAGSSSVYIKVFNPPTASIRTDKAQIYLGEAISIDWSSTYSSECSLKANNEPLPAGLGLTGTLPYSPDDSTEFTIECKNERGKVVTAKAIVAVIAESDVKLSFNSLESIDKSIDISSMTADCGPSCIYAPYDQARFTLGSDGIYRATDAYRADLEKHLSPLPGKVMLAASRTVAFDFAGSFGYGHREALNDIAQQKFCDQGFPFSAKGSALDSKTQFIDDIDSGIENIGNISQPDPIAFDIEVSTKAIAGVVKAGSVASLSYKLGNLNAPTEVEYQDFDKVRGNYKLSPNRSALLDVKPMSTRCELPGGENSVVVDRPAGAVDTPSAFAIAKNYFPEPRRYNINPNMFDPSDSLCSKQPWFKMPAAQGDPCYYVNARNINEKPGFVMPGSPRVASGLGIVQCKKYFGALADAYGLGDDWTATAELQYFITDSRFKNGCEGASCAGKEERTSENDWRFQDIEPARNKCVDRWAGLSWSDYQSRLIAACTSTQLYKNAVARNEAKASDQNFANACGSNPTCKGALDAMVGLTMKFSPQALAEIIDRESAAMQKAKNEGRAYFITDAKLSPDLVSEARTQIAVIESGLDTVQSLHASNKSNWISGNLIVHANQSVTGFDSYTESRNTLPAYKRQIDRINALIALDLREVSCNYDARGRFRKYELPKLSGDVKLNSVRQNTVTTKVKSDTRVSQ